MKYIQDRKMESKVNSAQKEIKINEKKKKKVVMSNV